jgi:hypothetical protein
MGKCTNVVGNGCAGDKRVVKLRSDSRAEVVAMLTRAMLDRLRVTVNVHRPRKSVMVAFDGPSHLARALPQSARRVRDFFSAPRDIVAFLHVIPIHAKTRWKCTCVNQQSY